MHTNSFDDLIPWMKRSGFVATALSALITSSFGWTLGETLIAKISLAGLLALCTFIVGYALTAAHAAYKRGMRGVARAATLLFFIGVAVEFLSHTGFTAAHRDATIKQAGFQTSRYDDARATVAQLSNDVTRIQERLRLAPTRTPEAAQAAIDNAMAHKFWRTTAECTKTKGPQTRQFCSDYATAVADKSLATEALTLKEDLKAKEADLKEARKVAAVTDGGHASGASQGLILASMMTVSETPDGSAVFWAGVGISSLLAIFAIAAGGLLNFIAFAFDAPAPATAPASQFPVAQAPTPATRHTERIVEKPIYINDNAALRRIAELVQGSGLMDAKAAA